MLSYGILFDNQTSNEASERPFLARIIKKLGEVIIDEMSGKGRKMTNNSECKHHFSERSKREK